MKDRRAKHEASKVTPKTETQRSYKGAIGKFQVVIGVGPAGCGKTYLAGAAACEALLNKDVDQIIIARPAVDAGEELGSLPGGLEDKMGPYIAAFRDVLDEFLGVQEVEKKMASGAIKIVPFAFMRGRTFKNSFVVLDEAQNTTPAQMKLFMTRVGENCKVVVNGDDSQKDIRGLSGLEDAINRLSWIPSLKVVRFSADDCVRSGFAAEVLKAYETPMPA